MKKLFDIAMAVLLSVAWLMPRHASADPAPSGRDVLTVDCRNPADCPAIKPARARADGQPYRLEDLIAQEGLGITPEKLALMTDQHGVAVNLASGAIWLICPGRDGQEVYYDPKDLKITTLGELPGTCKKYLRVGINRRHGAPLTVYKNLSPCQKGGEVCENYVAGLAREVSDLRREVSVLREARAAVEPTTPAPHLAQGAPVRTAQTTQEPKTNSGLPIVIVVLGGLAAILLTGLLLSFSRHEELQRVCDDLRGERDLYSRELGEVRTALGIHDTEDPSDTARAQRAELERARAALGLPDLALDEAAVQRMKEREEMEQRACALEQRKADIHLLRPPPSARDAEELASALLDALRRALRPENLMAMREFLGSRKQKHFGPARTALEEIEDVARHLPASAA